MPIQIIRQDITKLHTDAIVNPTNAELVPGGGVDEAIHRAAGPRLAAACAKLGGCGIGEAKLTPAFDLPCRYVIHTVGPVWRGGDQGERILLESCYVKSLQLAKARRCGSIAFPLISSGTYGYPKDQVLRIAMDCIGEFLRKHEMTVYVVVYDKTAYRLSEELYSGVTAYIDDVYTGDENRLPLERVLLKRRNSRRESAPMEDLCEACCLPASMPHPATLDEELRSMDKGFAATLFDYIDAKGMTDVECYKRANIDRKTFSKIKCSKNYKPGKATVLSFAIALRLTLEETNHLLNTVGLSLSRSSKFDVIVEYFIKNGKYDIYEINETLFAFDQMLLGA
ncbi:MAG: macro domain-containing protein [Ruminococcaceae bacterium]|nr:macro domain-containing protein [Oscillospiraceae bacterium]